MVTDKMSSTAAISSLKFYEKEDEIAAKLTNQQIEVELAETTSFIRAQLEQFIKQPELIEAPKFRDSLIIKTIMLRRLNRLSNFRNRLLRERFYSSRTKVEAHFLQLQNLKSEIRHLQKTISTCLEFQSLDGEIELVSIEEFNANAPKEINNIEVIQNDPHQLHLARLLYELEERKNLFNNLKELEARKSLILSDIHGKEQRLRQVKPKIEALKQSAKPLLDILGLKNVDALSFEQRNRSKYLANELELINLSANVYNELFDNLLEITYDGDIQKANCFIIDNKTKFNVQTLTKDDESDSDEEMNYEKEDEFEEEIASNKNKTRKSRKNSKKEEEEDETTDNLVGIVNDKLQKKRDILLNTHPMTLSIIIPLTVLYQSDKLKVHLSFIYLTELKCVGLKCKLLNANINNWQLFDSNILLDELFDNDFGSNCPNLVGNALLNVLNMKFSNYSHLVGKPYNFVQKLCGLEITEIESKTPPIENDLNLTNNKNLKNEKHSLTNLQLFELFADVIERIKNRIVARFALASNIEELEQSKNVELSSQLLNQQIPVRILSKLKSFASISTEDALAFNGLSAKQKLLLNYSVSNGLLIENGFQYKVVIERANFILHALIHIPTMYPYSIPLFFLVIKSEHSQSTEYFAAVLELERFLNITVEEWIINYCNNNSQNELNIRNEILIFQLKLLCSRLDVILELTSQRIADSTNKIEHEFMYEHVFTYPNNIDNFPFVFDYKTNSFCCE